MPGMDRTGPNGQGPLTGRQRGLCGSNDNRGFGRGRGRSMGRRNGFGLGAGRNNGNFDVAEDLAFWENEKKNLQNSLEAVEARIRQFAKPE